MIVKGKVVEETTYNNRYGSYTINSDEDLVEVVTNGEQALKDMLFIREGQNVEVYGELQDKMLLSKKGRILLENDDK